MLPNSITHIIKEIFLISLSSGIDVEESKSIL